MTENVAQESRKCIQNRIKTLNEIENPEKNLVELVLRLIRYNGLAGTPEIYGLSHIHQLAEIVEFTRRMRNIYPQIESTVSEFLEKYAERELRPEVIQLTSQKTAERKSAMYCESRKILLE